MSDFLTVVGAFKAEHASCEEAPSASIGHAFSTEHSAADPEFLP